MQLLPSVAKELARGTEVPYADAEDLFDPDINVPLGAKEIKSLLSEVRPAVHSRGGGLQRQWLGIRGWLKTRFRPDGPGVHRRDPYDENPGLHQAGPAQLRLYKRLNQSEGPVQFPEEWLRLVSK